VNHVAVTGASGFVGSQLISQMTKAGFEPILLCRKPTSTKHRAYDLNMSVKQLVTALAGCDQIVHLAARVHVMKAGDAASESDIYDLSNTEPTRRLSQAADSAGIKRLVFLSSAKVYGEKTEVDRSFEVGDAEKPEGAYARSKLEAENALRRLAEGYGFGSVVIRPPLVHGPGAKANLASLVRLSRSRLPLPFAAIDNRRSLVGIDNLCDLICKTLCREERDHLMLNATDCQDVSLPELMRLIAEAQGHKLHLLPFPEFALRQALRLVGMTNVADRLFNNLQLSMRKSLSILPWSPPVSLATGISRLVEHEGRY
jgi:UDP-glucose 4-epimerase